nr:hypothetical protein [Tanacetum cinerariifolium]
MGDTAAQTSMKLNELMALSTTLQNRVLELEKTKTSQHNEIASLKRRAEPSDDEESLGEDASKHRRIEAIDDDIQAKINDDHQLSERMQAQEQEELSDAEKATLFQQLLEKRRKHFATKRLEDKRNKPSTQAQKRKIIAYKRVNIFEDIIIELVKGKKRAGEELIQESTKKQRVEDDKETTELKQLMTIIPDKEKVAIDAIPLVVKSPKIVDWKIHKEGKKSYYQIVRADGKSQMYMVFSKMLESFDREDLEDLYKLEYEARVIIRSKLKYFSYQRKIECEVKLVSRVLPHKVDVKVTNLDLVGVIEDEGLFGHLSDDDQSILWWNKEPNVIPRGVTWSRKNIFNTSDYTFCFGKDSNLKSDLTATISEVQSDWYNGFCKFSMMFDSSCLIKEIRLKDNVISMLNTRVFKLEAIIQGMGRQINVVYGDKLDFREFFSALSEDLCVELNKEFIKLMGSPLIGIGVLRLDQDSDDDVIKRLKEEAMMRVKKEKPVKYKEDKNKRRQSLMNPDHWKASTSKISNGKRSQHSCDFSAYYWGNAYAMAKRDITSVALYDQDMTQFLKEVKHWDEMASLTTLEAGTSSSTTLSWVSASIRSADRLMPITTLLPEMI